MGDYEYVFHRSVVLRILLAYVCAQCRGEFTEHINPEDVDFSALVCSSCGDATAVGRVTRHWAERRTSQEKEDWLEVRALFGMAPGQQNSKTEDELLNEMGF